MKNKKIAIVIVGIVALLGITGMYIWWQHNDEVGQPPATEQIVKFNLEEELYSGSKLVEITAEEYNQLIQEQKSFVLIAHTEVCPAETPLTSTAEALVHDDGYTFYGLKGDEFKNSMASETIKYLPSAAVINRGEIVDYLDAESDEDIPYYQGADSLREWLQKYIKLERNK